MRKIVLVFVLSLSVFLLTACGKSENQFDEPKKGEIIAEIVIRDYGSIYVKFFAEEAPKAVENFTTHGRNGYYDGLTFHRIIEDFMIQGGDPNGTGKDGESIWGKAFKDEFSDKLHPYRGALCMANSGPNTNGSQFFIVQSEDTYDKDELTQLGRYLGKKFDDEAVKNYEKVGGTPWLFEGHTVFGQVYKGYDVLDAVAKVDKLDEEAGIPAEKVVIDTIKIYEYDKQK